MISWILVGILGGAVYWCWSTRNDKDEIEPKSEADMEREIIERYKAKYPHESHDSDDGGFNDTVQTNNDHDR